MKRHRPAGDLEDDRKAIRKELIDAKTMLVENIEASANKILKKPRKGAAGPVREVQGGQFESNRRKF